MALRDARCLIRVRWHAISWVRQGPPQDLLAQIDEMEDEMRWQFQLQGKPALYWMSSNYQWMRQVAFRASFSANAILFFSYPWNPMERTASDDSPGTSAEGAH